MIDETIHAGELGLSVFTGGVLAMLALWLLVGEPVSGYLTHRRFLADYRVDEVTARRRLYRQWTAMLATLGIALVTAFALLPGLSIAMLGLRPMRDFGAIDPGLKVILGGMGLGLFVSLVASAVARRRTGDPTAYMGGAAKVAPMLPRTTDERLAYLLLAIVASVVEEIAWRGLTVFLVSLCWPEADMTVMACVCGISFGAVHLYQGWLGVLTTGVMGAILCVVYLYSGSLLLPVVLHLAVNLRAAFMAPSANGSIVEAGHR